MKKGRHRRYEEARNLKRGPDLDIEALFTDLEGEPPVAATVVNDAPHGDIETDPDDLADEPAVGYTDQLDGDIETDPDDLADELAVDYTDQLDDDPEA